jgi:hypothetical protein
MELITKLGIDLAEFRDLMPNLGNLVNLDTERSQVMAIDGPWKVDQELEDSHSAGRPHLHQARWGSSLGEFNRIAPAQAHQQVRQQFFL